MSTSVAPKAADPAVRQCAAFLEDLLAEYGPRDFAVRFWDGSVREPDGGRPPAFTVHLKHAGAVRRMFTPPVQLTLAEAYFFDDFDIEGDAEAFWNIPHYLMGWRQRRRLTELLSWRWRLFRLPSGQARPAGWEAAGADGLAHTP